MARKTKMGMLKVTYLLLESLLNLSEDHKIVDIYATETDRQDNQFRVKISGPSMPILGEGGPITYMASVPDGEKWEEKMAKALISKINRRNLKNGKKT